MKVFSKKEKVILFQLQYWNATDAGIWWHLRALKYKVKLLVIQGRPQWWEIDVILILIHCGNEKGSRRTLLHSDNGCGWNGPGQGNIIEKWFWFVSSALSIFKYAALPDVNEPLERAHLRVFDSLKKCEHKTPNQSKNRHSSRRVETLFWGGFDRILSTRWQPVCRRLKILLTPTSDCVHWTLKRMPKNGRQFPLKF